MIDASSGDPHGNGMAILTDIGRQNVILIFTGRVCTVVTANAIAGDIRVIKIRRQPRHGGVAVIAVVPAGNMHWVLACRDGAVMTGCASTDNLRVIDYHNRLKERCTVAIFTDVAGQYVILIFPSRVRTIVTTNTIARVIRMIEGCWYPAVGRMAGIAVVTARDMGRVFANRDRIVVTGRAGADHLCVIHPIGRRKQDGIVAILTYVAGQYVIRIFANRIHAIVTIEAITRDGGVVEVCRQPGHRRMTGIAIVATGDVRRVFAARNVAVMT